MLAKLSDNPFDDDNWVFEIKWDGYRAIAETGKETKLYSRNGVSFEKDYTEVFKALEEIKTDAVIDGEIVAVDEAGHPSFEMLQTAKDTGIHLHYYVFDFLFFKGASLEDLPLLDRKKMLEEMLPKEHPIIHYCDHVETRGKDFFNLIKKQGLEGMIAKKKTSNYYEGSRSEDWLKIKHLLTDEAVIAGYTEGRGSRKYFGALMLGVYEDAELKYIGHTGTGFDQATLKMLFEKMHPLKTDSSPFNEKVKANAPVQWIKPELVCNVQFTEKTKNGSLRHPVFMGLRKDKTANEVNMADAGETIQPPKKSTAKKKGDTLKKVGGNEVKLTNLDKVFFPEEGFTKGDIIDYYDGISKYILPYLKGRPLSLLRNPNGIKGKSFFHKDAGENAPDFVDTETVHSDSGDKNIEYIVCNNKATLLYLANLGCIELNPWHSHVGNLENPDYLLIDLDPSDANSFEQVIETALITQAVFDEAGAPCFCKTSGSTGMHIMVPLGGKYSYDQVNTFSHIIAAKVVEQLPEFTSIERSLKKRGKKIYVDFMQNRRGQTIACPYSARPKPGATVSAPLEWKEVKPGLSIADFDITNMLQRAAKTGDLFKGILGKGIDMVKCLKRLEE